MPTIKVMSAGAVQSMVAGARPRIRARNRQHARSHFQHRRLAARPLQERRERRPGHPVGVDHRRTGQARPVRARQRHRSRPHRHRRGGARGRARAGYFHAGGVQAGAAQGQVGGLYRSEGGRLRRHHVRRLAASGSASPRRSTRRPCSASAAPRWRDSIAEGRAEIGTTFISEVLPVKGRQSGRPAAGRTAQRQYLYGGDSGRQRASRDAAAALLRALTDPATRARWTAAGLEPAF